MKKEILPGQQFNSKLFSISFPDSIYNAGIISIGKLKVEEVKYKSTIKFKNHQYFYVQYLFSKKYKEEVMNRVLQESSQYNYKLDQVRRKYILTLTLKKESK